MVALNHTFPRKASIGQRIADIIAHHHAGDSCNVKQWARAGRLSVRCVYHYMQAARIPDACAIAEWFASPMIPQEAKLHLAIELTAKSGLDIIVRENPLPVPVRRPKVRDGLVLASDLTVESVQVTGAGQKLLELASRAARDHRITDQERCQKPRPSHRLARIVKLEIGGKSHTKRDAGKQINGDALREQVYLPPTMANPGNLVKVVVGGGLLGHPLAHENEAPYPVALAEWFIKSLCPPGGLVLDPFSGSGTTVDAANRCGRNGIGTDLRMSQCELGTRRMLNPHMSKPKKNKSAAAGVEQSLFAEVAASQS